MIVCILLVFDSMICIGVMVSEFVWVVDVCVRMINVMNRIICVGFFMIIFSKLW